MCFQPFQSGSFLLARFSCCCHFGPPYLLLLFGPSFLVLGFRHLELVLDSHAAHAIRCADLS